MKRLFLTFLAVVAHLDCATGQDYYQDVNRQPTAWGRAAGVPKVFHGGATVTVKLNGCVAIVNVNPGTDLANKSDASMQALADIAREMARDTPYDHKNALEERCRLWARAVKTEAAQMTQNNPRNKERRYPRPSLQRGPFNDV